MNRFYTRFSSNHDYIYTERLSSLPSAEAHDRVYTSHTYAQEKPQNPKRLHLAPLASAIHPPLRHVPLHPQNHRHMLTQRHHLPALIHNHTLEIHPPIPDLLRPNPRKKPLDPFGRQHFLDLQVQQQRRIPEPRGSTRALARSLHPGVRRPARWLVDVIRIRLGAIGLDDLRPHVADVAETLGREALAAREAEPLVGDGAVELAAAGKVEAHVLRGLAEGGEGHVGLHGPVGVGVVFQSGEVDGGRGGVEDPVGGEGEAGFGVHVGVGDVADDFSAVVLAQGDVYGGGLPAEFGVVHGEVGGAGGGAAQEFEVQGYGVRLVLRGEGGGEVGADDVEEDGGHEAAVRNWGVSC